MRQVGQEGTQGMRYVRNKSTQCKRHIGHNSVCGNNPRGAQYDSIYFLNEIYFRLFIFEVDFLLKIKTIKTALVWDV